MSISGIFLVLFLTLHMVLNFTSVFSAEAFQKVCDFMGTPVISIMVPVLAFGFVIHIIYAFILTLQNRSARGESRYSVTSRPKSVEWASQNMFVLGLIVLCFLVLHLYQFWAKMQLPEIMGEYPASGREALRLLSASLGYALSISLALLPFGSTSPTVSGAPSSRLV